MFAEDAWHVRFDCAQTEIAFLQKRLAQLEERLGAEHSARTGLEQKASAARPAPALWGGIWGTQGRASEQGCCWAGCRGAEPWVLMLMQLLGTGWGCACMTCRTKSC